MTPKQFIKYTRYLDKHNVAICDGGTMSYNMGLFELLYPLFIVSGIGFFLWLLLYFTRVKETITGDKK